MSTVYVDLVARGARNLTMGERMILLLLAHHANKDHEGRAHPSVAFLAAEAEMTRRAVRRILSALANAEYVEAIGDRRGGVAKPETVTHWRINVDKLRANIAAHWQPKLADLRSRTEDSPVPRLRARTKPEGVETEDRTVPPHGGPNVPRRGTERARDGGPTGPPELKILNRSRTRESLEPPETGSVSGASDVATPCIATPPPTATQTELDAERQYVAKAQADIHAILGMKKRTPSVEGDARAGPATAAARWSNPKAIRPPGSSS